MTTIVKHVRMSPARMTGLQWTVALGFGAWAIFIGLIHIAGALL